MCVKKSAVNEALRWSENHVPTMCNLIAQSGAEVADWECHEGGVLVELVGKFAPHCGGAAPSTSHAIDFLFALSAMLLAHRKHTERLLKANRKKLKKPVA